VSDGVAIALTAGMTLVALYFLVAISLWSRFGIGKMRNAIERIASGELTVRIAQEVRRIKNPGCAKPGAPGRVA
jgi:hypothetical protein